MIIPNYNLRSVFAAGSRVRKRSSFIIPAVILLFIVIQFLHIDHFLGIPLPRIFGKSLTPKDQFYYNLFDAIANNRPTSPPPDTSGFRNSDKCPLKGDIGLNDVDKYSWASYENLLHCYNVTESQYHNLHETHASFVKQMQDQMVMSRSLRNSLFPNDKGIVTIGGGRYSVLAFTMIKTLREKGTTLPVEVIIPPIDKGDKEFCETLLPQYNARCVYFDDVLPQVFADNLQLKSYQFKSLGLLISSFKKIIFIDADNLPMKNLDGVFNTNVFKKTGLITWPDIWRRVTSPVYYKIANIDFNLHKRVRNMGDDVSPVSRYDNVIYASEHEDHFLQSVPFHDLEGTLPDPTTESGQIIIDKVRHLHTLVLATYYNFYGPLWFYKMFSQGTSGEGDKETFVAAALALKKPFYQVKTKVELDGFFDPDGDGFKGIGIYQHDFEQDYNRYQNAIKKVQHNLDKYSEYDSGYTSENSFYKSLLTPENEKPVDVMFVHASFFKLDPFSLYKFKRYVDKNNKQYRGYRKPQRLNNFDLELFEFEVMKDTFCAENPVAFKHYFTKMNLPAWKEMCSYLNDHVVFLKETHDDFIAGNYKF